MFRKILFFSLVLSISFIGCEKSKKEVGYSEDNVAAARQEPVKVDHTSTDLFLIPDYWISKAKTNLHIAYQHTSHGSHILSGMDALKNFPSFGSKYDWDDSGQRAGALDLDDYGIPGCADLSQCDIIDVNGVTPWVTATRNLLNNEDNYHINVIIWSWCSINNHNAQRYIDNMELLISEYSNGGSNSRAADYPVKFVFMTGHAEGVGENSSYNSDTGNGSIHYNNELIRLHCFDNKRILFDFADIEAYDPDGNYFWDLNMQDDLDYTGGNWAQEWISENTGSELEQLTTGSNVDDYTGCVSCVHSDDIEFKKLNCILKGRAAWWLWASLAGWNGV